MIVFVAGFLGLIFALLLLTVFALCQTLADSERCESGWEEQQQ